MYRFLTLIIFYLTETCIVLFQHKFYDAVPIYFLFSLFKTTKALISPTEYDKIPVCLNSITLPNI
jgi:hypothetical protein